MLNYILEYILHRKVVYRVVLRWLLFMGFSHFLLDPPCFMDIDSRRLMIWALPFSRMSSSWILVQTWALRGIRDGTLWLCGFVASRTTVWLCDFVIAPSLAFAVSLWVSNLYIAIAPIPLEREFKSRITRRFFLLSFAVRLILSRYFDRHIYMTIWDTFIGIQTYFVKNNLYELKHINFG